MSSMILLVYTTKHIGTKEYAENFFKILEKYNMLPDKIGIYDPVKEPYSLNKAIELWTFADGYAPDFRMGLFIGKKKEPNIRFDVSWHIGERARANYIAVWFTRKSFKQLKDEIENLFKELIICFNAFYGYVSDYKIVYRQHVTGTIEDRLHGIFWCNYFGEVYVNFFGKEKILNASWFKTEIFNKGIITYLTKEPGKELLESDELELSLKKQLGEDSFGDVEEYKANLKRQKKNVPKLDFSEIRKPISNFIK